MTSRQAADDKQQTTSSRWQEDKRRQADKQKQAEKILTSGDGDTAMEKQSGIGTVVGVSTSYLLGSVEYATVCVDEDQRVFSSGLSSGIQLPGWS